MAEHDSWFTELQDLIFFYQRVWVCPLGNYLQVMAGGRLDRCCETTQFLGTLFSNKSNPTCPFRSVWLMKKRGSPVISWEPPGQMDYMDCWNQWAKRRSEDSWSWLKRKNRADACFAPNHGLLSLLLIYTCVWLISPLIYFTYISYVFEDISHIFPRYFPYISHIFPIGYLS